jgi:predicted nucleic acid-binding Zn ribbon protein
VSRRDDDLHSVGEAIDEVVRSLRGTGARAVQGVFAGWEAAVGAQVAAHATPVSLEAGRLVVEVDQPGWATQLRFLEQTLIERLAEVAGAGAVTAIEVRVARR